MNAATFAAEELSQSPTLTIRDRTHNGLTLVEMDYISPRIVRFLNSSITTTTSGQRIPLSNDGYTIERSEIGDASISDLVNVIGIVTYNSKRYNTMPIEFSAMETNTQITIVASHEETIVTSADDRFLQLTSLFSHDQEGTFRRI